MAIIDETPLLGRVFFETSPNTGTATWTDHTETVNNMTLTRGGRTAARGVSDVQAGTAYVSLVDNTATIAIGYWVRVRTTSGNVWAGYVQDISTDYQFIDGAQYVVKNLLCVDWVGYAGQFIFPYATGLEDGGTAISATPYWADKRINALNFSVDNTGETQLVTKAVGSANGVVGHSDRALSLAQNLDLLANTVGGYWNATTATPTNGTTGRDGLILFTVDSTPDSSTVQFSDGTHSTGTYLRYTDITVGQTSSNVANTVLMRNRGQLSIASTDVAYDTDLMYSHEYTWSDSTSVAAYGSRQISVETNFGLLVGSGTSANTQKLNRVLNPNFEYDELGWNIGDTTNSRYALKKPSLDANPFAAKSGEWAMRNRVLAASNQQSINYLADNRDGIDVVAGQKYGVSFWGARTTSRSGYIYADVRWFDTDNNLISTSSGSGSTVTMTNQATWYQARYQFTAPANAVTAKLRFFWQRTTGLQWQVGDKLWIDKVTFWRMENASDWYENDGEPYIDTSEINFSLDRVGASYSVTTSNPIHYRATRIVDDNSTPETVPQTLTWNAQEDLSKVHLIDLNKTVKTYFDGSSYIQKVLGITHEISRSRWIVRLELEPHEQLLLPG